MDTIRAELLYSRAAADEANEQELDQLYEAFFFGLNLSYLRKLLQSRNPSVVRNATHILSELRSKARPLIDECPALLAYDDTWVRSDALDVVLINATSEDSELIAEAIQLVDDEHLGIAWKSLGFLRRLDDVRLRSALLSGQLAHFAPCVDWLLRQSEEGSLSEILAWIGSDEWHQRAFGAVAAAKQGLRGASMLRTIADKKGDAAARFAADFIEDLAYSANHDTEH